MPDADDTTVVDDVEEEEATEGFEEEDGRAVASSSNRSARNSPITAAAPSSRPRSTTKPKAQPSGGSLTVAGPGTESRRAPAARSSHSRGGRFTILTRHGRSGGYWTTRMPRGR